MRIEVIDNREKLSEIKDLWVKFSRENFPHLCNDYYWNITALNSYFPGSPIRVFLFYDQDELVGILPLCLNKSTFSKLPVWKYHFFEQGIGQSTTTILSSCINECFETFWKQIPTRFSKFNILRLTLSENEQKELSPFLVKIQSEGYTVYRTEKKVLGIESKSRDEYWNKIFTKHRRNEFRRIENKLLQHFQPEYELPDPDETSQQFANFWHRFIDLYQHSWKRRSHRSISEQPSEQAFFKFIFQHYAQQNQLIVSFLKLNQKDAASAWWIIHNETVYGIQTIFNREFQKYSPGWYLLQKDILTLLDQGFTKFNLMGSQTYKRYLCNRTHLYSDVYILNRNFYGKILKYAGVFSRVGLHIPEH